MAKLEDSKGQLGESYARVFGNVQMALLFSKVQALVIRSGFELERVIEEAIPSEMFTTLEELSEISQDAGKRPPIQVVSKPSKPDPDHPEKSIQADFLIVDHLQRRFMLVEVKEGYVFDTKKADGELASLKNITSWLAQEYAYRTHYFLCAFNQENKDAIVQGAKKRFSVDHILTGREFCELIGIDYEALCERRRKDQADNRRYFLSGLLAIPEVHNEILELLGISHA